MIKTIKHCFDLHTEDGNIITLIAECYKSVAILKTIILLLLVISNSTEAKRTEET